STVISLLPFGFSKREHIFIGWVGLRGAVPIVLALFPFMAGLPGANIIFEVAFVIVMVSLIVQGSTLAPLARKLKLEVPKPSESKLRIPLNRVETGNHELVLIPLKGRRWLRPVPLSKLHLPEQTQVGALFRGGNLYGCDTDEEVMEGDVLAVFSTHEQVSTVNRLLDGTEPPERLSDLRFFGEFLLEGQATLGDVQLVYGFKADRLLHQKTLSEC